ncbi:HK97 gp10 family phage protein [Actinoplanes regularis]|uniref:HK97 gp10 family phage protein n=1 Tax=Actinoplanes regularis TaxID=52697 RepID=UPI0024A1C26E|nr:HK97 gp10 family phage protein [Actinoplanes regularis]GLW32273.1 hypothetical protein Areg01_52120 [Actinoplanes regularis]
MADRVDLRDTKRYLRGITKQVRAQLRKEAARVRKEIRAEVRGHRRTGELERKIRVRTGVDADGPYARVTTSARRISTSERTGKKTTFRYGLALAQTEHYMKRGLQRTPRR